MQKSDLIQRVISIVLVATLFFSFIRMREKVTAQAPGGYVFREREIELTELELAGTGGLAFSPLAGEFIIPVSPSGQAPAAVAMVNLIEQVDRQVDLPTAVGGPHGLAFLAATNSGYVLNAGATTLSQISAGPDGKLPPGAQAHASSNMASLGLQDPNGMAFDPASGRLFVLDGQGKRLTVLAPAADGSYDGDNAMRENRVQRINLGPLGVKSLNGLAFNPTNSHLFTLDPDTRILYELADDGSLLGTTDLSQENLVDPQAMVVAPSGDPTDDPANQTLYIADPGRNFIVEFSLTEPVMGVIAAAAATFTHVNTIETFRWNPSSPDPIGADLLPNGNLIVSDSEVDEMNIYQGANVFITTTAGSLVSTCTTLPFSKEPTDVTVNPSTGMIYFSNDGKHSVHQVGLGPDGRYCTADDTLRTMDTLTFNSADAEGIAYANGDLYIADGMGKEVYRIRPGNNGIFDGAPPAGDDQVTHWDVLSLGLRDPEGIRYHPVRNSLFLVGRGDLIMIEASLTGTLLNTWNISQFNPIATGGVAIAPGSQNPGVLDIFITDRMVDNNDNPNENDGRIYEISIDGSAPPPPGPTPTPLPTPTPTLTPPPPDQTGPIRVYLSLVSSVSLLGNLNNIKDEDVISFDGTNFNFLFQGADAGVASGDVDAFFLLDADSLLLSFDATVTVPGIGAVQEWDVVRFDATSLGTTTAGTFSLYFDGEDVGLDVAAEDVDAFDVLPDGKLAISFAGNSNVLPTTIRDEDLVTFTPSSLGGVTAGTWSMYFDGSDVGLDTDSGEDLDGASVGADANLYLSTRNVFSVNGVSGQGADVFACTPSSLGNTTACAFSPTLYFDGSAFGLSANIDALEVP